MWNKGIGRSLIRGFGILAVLVLMSGCNNLFGGDSSSDANTIVDIVSETDSLSSLLTTIEYIDQNGSQADSADLATLLSGDGPFTVFAPNNAAFDDLDETVRGLNDGEGDFGANTTVAALENALGSSEAAADALYKVVANHAASGEVTSGDLTDGQTIDTLADPDGNDSNFGLTIDLSDGVTVNASATGGDVVNADVDAANGVAHVVDKVLLDTSTVNALSN